MTAPVISTITNTGTITLPTDTDTLVGKATTDILTNKTLTAPQINDTSSNHQYIFGVSELSDDRTVTLPLLTGNDVFVFNDHIHTLSNKTLTAPKFVGGGYIADSAGLELIKFSQTASAVNEITITNASTGTGPSITATGGDDHIDLSLSGQGNGSVIVTANLTVTGSDITLGNGNDATIGPAAVSGEDTDGKDLIIHAGAGTGIGAGGNIVFQVADGGAASGSTANNLVPALTIADDKTATFNSYVTGVTPTSDAHLATKSYVDSFPISNFTIVSSPTLTIASQENEIYHVQNNTKKIALPTNPRIGQKIKLVFDKVNTVTGATVITPYNINIITTTGSGSGAVISSVIISGGNITSFTLLSGGTGYTNTSTIAITVNGTTYTAYTFNNIGDFTDGVLKTTAFTGLNLTLLTGTGVSDGIYSNNVVVNNISGSGSGALISSLVVAANNTITSFILYNGGTGYTNTSTISITVNGITYSTYSITSDDLVGTVLKTGVVFSGSLTTPSGSLASGTYNNLVVTLSIAQNGADSVGVNATMLSAAVASNSITDFTLISGGSGFVANNTLTITINGSVYSPYTIGTNDITSGILKTTAFTGVDLSRVLGSTLTNGTYTNTASFKGYVRVHDIEHSSIVNAVFSTLLSHNISLDGTVKGGYGGDILEFLYTGNSIWFVEGLLWSDGNPSTPFS